MGKQWKQWQTLFSWAPKSLQMVTTAMKLKDTYSLEEKLWPPYSILKSRDITLPTKVNQVKAMVFPVVMYGCESWTIKKAECWRIDAFELWCWRRLLRVPWTARRSKQSIQKEISPECSLVGLMLKLRLQYFGHLMWGTDSFEKTLMLGKIEGRRRRGWHRMRWLDGITDSWTWVWVNSGSWWWTGRPGVLWFMGPQRVGHNWVIELNWEICYHLSWFLSTSLIWPYVYTSLISSACYIHMWLLAITLDNAYIENLSLQEVLLDISGINNCWKYGHRIESKTKNFFGKESFMCVYVYTHIWI